MQRFWKMPQMSRALLANRPGKAKADRKRTRKIPREKGKRRKIMKIKKDEKYSYELTLATMKRCESSLYGKRLDILKHTNIEVYKKTRQIQILFNEIWQEMKRLNYVKG